MAAESGSRTSTTAALSPRTSLMARKETSSTWAVASLFRPEDGRCGRPDMGWALPAAVPGCRQLLETHAVSVERDRGRAVREDSQDLHILREHVERLVHVAVLLDRLPGRVEVEVEARLRCALAQAGALEGPGDEVESPVPEVLRKLRGQDAAGTVDDQQRGHRRGDDLDAALLEHLEEGGAGGGRDELPVLVEHDGVVRAVVVVDQEDRLIAVPGVIDPVQDVGHVERLRECMARLHVLGLEYIGESLCVFVLSTEDRRDLAGVAGLELGRVLDAVVAVQPDALPQRHERAAARVD